MKEDLSKVPIIELHGRLERVRGQLLQSQGYAHYWSCVMLSEPDRRKDASETAKRHLEHMGALTETAAVLAQEISRRD